MRKIYKKFSLVAALALVAALLAAPATYAWGPENRPTFTNQEPAKYAVFNSITNNAAVGDERDFVRVAEKNQDAHFTSDLKIEAGKQYEVYIYYHNDASATYNDRAHGYAGVARDVRVSSLFPLKLSAGERGVISGKIAASNTDPKEVWDEAYITPDQDITLHYIEGSAKIYNKYGVNGSVLSTNLFSDMGVFIGLNELNGVILGCDEYSGQIVYTIQTVAVDHSDPSDPDVEPDPTPEDPEDPTPKPVVPAELPKTGPLTIILLVVIAGLIIAGIVYFIKSRKEVKKLSKRAKGKK